MFAKFRKHHKWIWIMLLILIIPSFVVFFYDFDPIEVVQGGASATGYDFGSINNEPITRSEFLAVQKEVRIRSFLRNGQWPGADQETQDQLMTDTIQRLFLIREMEKMGIEASPIAIGRVANQQLQQQLTIDQFEEQYLRPQQLTKKDYQNYLEHDVGISQLYSAVTVSAKLLPPAEVEKVFREENENIHTEAALFVNSNYLDKVTVTDEALQKFYTDQSPRYRIPNRVRVSYVAFAANQYTNEALQRLESNTNLTALIDESYVRQGADAFKDTNDVVLTEEAAKEKIKDAFLSYTALEEAHRQANDFANELFEMPQPNQADDLEKLAAAKGMTVEVTEPFNYRDGLEDTTFPPEFRQQAMQLNAQTKPLLIEPIVGTNAVYLISLKEEIPSELPPFETLQDKVMEDYKMTEARKLVSAAAGSFAFTATNQLQAGVAFKDICATAGVQHVDLVPFSPSSTPPLEGLDPLFNLSTLQRVSAEMEPGELSYFLPYRDGGYLLYLEKRTPVEDSKVQEGLPELAEQMRRFRQNQAFQAWLMKASERANLRMPQREEEPMQTPPQAGS